MNMDQTKGKRNLRVADLCDDIRLTFDKISGVAELIAPALDMTCDNHLQRRPLETLSAALDAFVDEGLVLVQRLEDENCGLSQIGGAA